MNWVGILSIAVSLLTVISGATLKQFFDLRREIGELKIEHQKILSSVAERFVRSADFVEFKQMIRQEFAATRQEITAMQQGVVQMTGLLHELKGAAQANNPTRT